MAYVLEPKTVTMLQRSPESIDPEIADLRVSLRQDNMGEAVLAFLVVLKDSFTLGKPSAATGARLQRIASALRQRAADAGILMFPSVRFALASELQEPPRKSA